MFALCRVGELLDYGSAFVPEGLISEPSWHKLRTLSDVLPPVVAIGAFECRLEESADRVDFETCIRAAGNGRAKLAGELAHLERAVEGESRWDRSLAFLRAWTDPTTPVFDAVPVVWLEFDLDPTSDAPTPPFVVFTLNKRIARCALDGEHTAAILLGIELLSGGAIARTTLGTFERALRGLPSEGSLLHVAMRPGAGGDGLRIVIRAPWRELPSYLSKMDWPGSKPELFDWLELTCRDSIMHSVNLDIDTGVGARVGVEHYCRALPNDDIRWDRLFTALIAAGACTEERRFQLTQWLAPSNEVHHPHRGLLRIDRELLIKVVYQTGEPIRAKAYLPFGARLDLR